MVTPIHVLGFAGSLRKGSYNRGLLRAAAELLPEGMTLETFDLIDIPLYNGDIEAQGLPEPVQRFRERIAAVDALLIATPEYNHSISGVLKNAIDWVSRPPNQPLNGKPVAIMGGGGVFGSVRAQIHLRYLLVSLNMAQLNKPEVLIPNIAEKFDENITLIDSDIHQRIRTMLEALANWTRKLRDRD